MFFGFGGRGTLLFKVSHNKDPINLTVCTNVPYFLPG